MSIKQDQNRSFFYVHYNICPIMLWNSLKYNVDNIIASRQSEKFDVPSH